VGCFQEGRYRLIIDLERACWIERGRGHVLREVLIAQGLPLSACVPNSFVSPSALVSHALD
jgi:hypothetical protein